MTSKKEPVPIAVLRPTIAVDSQLGGFVSSSSFLGHTLPEVLANPMIQGLKAELLRACDAVVTKPGYGIVAASLVNGVRVLYTTRDDFPETPILVRALEEHATAQVVPLADLAQGAIGGPLEALLARPVVESGLAADGAEHAAEMLAREIGC